jgi:nucleoside-diphosphate-sugar epimerase
VYISSTAVYGVPKVHPLDETAPLQGVGPYGESKIEAEKVCEEFRREGVCVPILRPKTFIGSGRLGVFQILFEWVQEGKRIPVIGNGKNRYQLMEVRDFVDAILLAVESPADRANDTFNVGAKRFGTVSEDMTALCRYAGSGARVMATPAPLVKVVLRLLERFHLTPLYKWVYETADKDSFVSTQKIEERLGWSPKYSNAEALIEAYAWYQEHASELKGASGITHRVAWDQGALKFFKRWL